VVLLILDGLEVLETWITIRRGVDIKYLGAGLGDDLFFERDIILRFHSLQGLLFFALRTTGKAFVGKLVVGASAIKVV
jgi:hypothetical protein